MMFIETFHCLLFKISNKYYYKYIEWNQTYRIIKKRSNYEIISYYKGFNYKRIMNNKELKLYYQHFFEDTSGLRFWNRLDGLWGIELSNYIKNTNILFEYLNNL